MTVHVAPRIERLRTDDGVELAVHRLGEPDAPPVLLVPGTFSNSTFWTGTRGSGFARTLAAHGYEAWCLDPRGHGQSQRQGTGQRWRFDQWARYDVPAAFHAAARNGLRPVIIGHSAGGSASLAALTDPTLRDAALAAVIIATPLPWLQIGRAMLATMVRALAARLHTFPARSLRLGPEDEPAGVLEQWFDWNLHGHWAGDDGADYSHQLSTLRLPLLMLAGAGDRLWAPPHACRALFDSIGSTNRSFVLCGRDSGFTRDYGHADIVASSAAAAEVWPLIIKWLKHL